MKKCFSGVAKTSFFSLLHSITLLFQQIFGLITVPLYRIIQGVQKDARTLN